MNLEKKRRVAFLCVTSIHDNVLAERRGGFIGLPCLEVESLDDIVALSKRFHHRIDGLALMTHARNEQAMVIGRQSGIWNNEPADFIFLALKRSTVWVAFNGAVTIDLSKDSNHTFDFTMDVAKQFIPHVRPCVAV